MQKDTVEPDTIPYQGQVQIKRKDISLLHQRVVQDFKISLDELGPKAFKREIRGTLEDGFAQGIANTIRKLRDVGAIVLVED